MKKQLAFVALLLSASVSAYEAGDPEIGKSKSMVCAACHGADGNSVIPANPRLAGQHERYLYKQLVEFKQAAKSGGEEGRNNMVMNGIASGLSDDDMRHLAAYFASQTPAKDSAPEDVVEAGQALYRAGDQERNIAACIACHGPTGNGVGLAGFPDISGNHPEYTAAQLKMFRSGERHNDLNGMMRGVAAKLTDEDIRVLSEYLAGLH